MGSQEGRKIAVSGQRILALAVILMVAGAVVYGMILAGPPGKARQQEFDSRRLDSLRQIAYAIQDQASRTGQLPVSLSDLAAPNGYLDGSQLADPETGQPFGYQADGSGGEYQLCADLAYASDQASHDGFRPMSAPLPFKPGLAADDSDTSQLYGPYQAGHHCFSLKADLTVNQAER